MTQGDPTHFTVIREASAKAEMEANKKTQQAHEGREEVDCWAISAVQVGSCFRRHLSIEYYQGPRRTLLAVRWQETDGRPSHAIMPKVAKRVGYCAAQG